MFQKTNAELKKISPRDAQRFLTLNTFKDQRPLRPTWISELANNIRQDLFRTGEIGVALFQNGDGTKEKYLVNGQHQCEAIIVANKSVEALIETFDCGESIEDVSLLYRQYDNFRGRSLPNLVAMESTALGLGWPNKIASLVVSAAALKEGKVSSHKNKKVELLKYYVKPGYFINEILTHIEEGSWQKHCKHLLRSPVVCAMMSTWDKCQKDSEIFWIQVRDGEFLKKTDPSFKLREFLRESSFDRGRGASGHKVVGTHEMIAKCIHAWNAYRSNGKTSLKYYSSKPVPKAI